MRVCRWVLFLGFLGVGCSFLSTPLAAPSPTLHRDSAPSQTPSPSGAESSWWEPALAIRWQWQLTGEEIDTTFDVDVYDLDAFETSAETVDSLHRRGRRVVCYISAGSWEDWRPDSGEFPAEVIGAVYEGWEGERWLDIRRIDLLGPILQARMDLCKSKGFDAVEPDNIDGYQNDTGFPLSAADQLAFNRWLARQAHARGLGIGLKNDAEQVSELAADFDFALAEDCFDQGWCELLLPFLPLGKPVLDAEYTDTGITLEDFCPQAEALGIRAILKHRELDAWRQGCP